MLSVQTLCTASRPDNGEYSGALLFSPCPTHYTVSIRVMVANFDLCPTKIALIVAESVLWYNKCMAQLRARFTGYFAVQGAGVYERPRPMP